MIKTNKGLEYGYGIFHCSNADTSKVNFTKCWLCEISVNNNTTWMALSTTILI